MRKIIPFILFILCGSLIASIISCTEDDDCSGNERHMLAAKILTVIKTDSAVWETSYSLDSLTVYAFGTDSIIINNDLDVSSLRLPLRTNVEETTLVFSYTFHEGDTLPQHNDKDTLVFRHHNTPYFLTLDCNFVVKQEVTDLRYTTHVLDSIVIVNPTATLNDDKENIKIYY
ncbi:MAG: calcium-binding protein P [Bacteroidaceae bacterium]|nr:calcium-binding protein P [Bacteroidaceae bacterium]